MSWLVGGWTELGQVAGKAVLIYVVAVVVLRFAQRRTISQWTIIDFATAVAVGAVVGRTAIASGQSFATGAVALVTLVVIHRLASLMRLHPVVARFMDHRVRVLVEHGRLRTGELRLCGLTDADVYSHLRQRGVSQLSDVAYLLYEAKGGLTVVREAPEPLGGLIMAGLDAAADWPEREAPTTGTK